MKTLEEYYSSKINSWYRLVPILRQASPCGFRQSLKTHPWVLRFTR